MSKNPKKSADDIISIERILGERLEKEKKARQEAEYALEKRSYELSLLNADLEKSKERYDLAMLGSNDGLWDWNLQDNSIFFSNRWKGILGIELEDIKPSLDTWTRPCKCKRSSDVLFKKTRFAFRS
jgi:PAS domain-containing protein